MVLSMSAIPCNNTKESRLDKIPRLRLPLHATQKESSTNHFFTEQLSPFLAHKSLGMVEASFRIFIILAVSYMVTQAIRLGLEKFEKVILSWCEREDMERIANEKRVKTLIGMLRTICLTLGWIIGIRMSLDQIGLDITPILAGTDIVSLAVSFGAQNLVRDVINGFFMILENQIRVGDVAVVNGTGGLVEAISFRTMTLRDLSGTVHIFPHCTITTIANKTKEWSACVMEIGVNYQEDTDRVGETMRNVQEDLQQDPQMDRKILEPIEISGVDAFGESEVMIKARIKNFPIEQWAVRREYRRRLKNILNTRTFNSPSRIEPDMWEKAVHLGSSKVLPLPHDGCLR